MAYIYVIVAFILAMVLSYFILPRIILISYKKNLFDEIDERKVHTKQIPRLGGVSFPLIVILSLLFVTGVSFVSGNGIVQTDVLDTLLRYVFLICGMMLLFMIGIADDLIGVNYRYKFIVQIIAASFFPVSGLYISNLGGLFGLYAIPSWIGMAVTVFLVVYITNAINLIDGIDGLASGICGIALMVIGAILMIQGIWVSAMLAFIVLGLLIPFFYFNVFGNVDRLQKLFMGDTGSLTLGYLISFLMIHFCTDGNAMTSGTLADNNAIVMVFSVMIVPCFDVVRIVLVRICNGRSPFQPDRNHIHHKFLLINYTPQRSMLSILCIVLFFAGSNAALISYIDAHLILCFDIICWIALHFFLNIRILQCNVEKTPTKRKRIVLSKYFHSTGLIAK